MPDKPNVLVLCTGNSCRSQMAEGYLRQLGGDRFSVHSAGTEPQASVHPLAVAVMLEDGVDISQQRPRHVQEFLGKLLVRYLIIVCDGANKSCPRVFPGVSEKLFWPFDDPAAFAGSAGATLEKFRAVRDQIKERIRSWLEA